MKKILISILSICTCSLAFASSVKPICPSLSVVHKSQFKRAAQMKYGGKPTPIFILLGQEINSNNQTWNTVTGGWCDTGAACKNQNAWKSIYHLFVQSTLTPPTYKVGDGEKLCVYPISYGFAAKNLVLTTGSVNTRAIQDLIKPNHI